MGTVATGAQQSVPANGKFKIFILAGQPNMVGFGQLESKSGTMATDLKRRPEDYSHLVDKGGKHVVRDDVWIVNLSYEGKEQQGLLTTGHGATTGLAATISVDLALGSEIFVRKILIDDNPTGLVGTPIGVMM